VGFGAKPQPTNDLVHIGVESAALVAAVFVDFPFKTHICEIQLLIYTKEICLLLMRPRKLVSETVNGFCDEALFRR